MTESVLNIELHPNFFAYAVKSPDEVLYSKAHIEHLATHTESGIDLIQLSNWLKSLQKIWSDASQKIFISIHGYPVTITNTQDDAKITHEVLIQPSPTETHLVQGKLNDDFVWSMSIPLELKSILNNYFVQPTISPSVLGFCRNVYENTTNISQLHLYITPQIAYFYYQLGNQPNYYNSFHYKNKEDLLYYILLVYKMLNLKTDSYPLILSGMIEKESEIFHLLYQYIRNVYIEECNVPVQDLSNEDRLLQSNYLANLIYTSN
ncbi:MAG TPA: DUF3822 family protein [Chitinophagales bacterium]|nr:DUF3822 family protein [Chitinophagales bacterium]